MNTQDIRNLQEAYLEVYEGAAGDVAARAAKLERQRKGQTPERQEMYRKLKNKAQEREEEPKTIERHQSLGYKGGGTFGAGGHMRTGLTQSDRDRKREGAATSSRRLSPYDPKYKKHTEGSGAVTKNPKKLRKQKAMGEIGENYDLYDIILSHLLDEGYADTEQAATAIMVNMSEEWRESIMISEGMTMKDFKNQRSRQKQKEKRADLKTSPTRRAGIHADKASPERAARHRANVDPDFEGNDERNYPGGKLNPKKVRKAKALGELG